MSTIIFKAVCFCMLYFVIRILYLMTTSPLFRLCSRGSNLRGWCAGVLKSMWSFFAVSPSMPLAKPQTHTLSSFGMRCVTSVMRSARPLSASLGGGQGECSLGSLWGLFGVTLSSLWGLFGVSLGSLYRLFGVTFGSLWGHFGVSLGFL